MLGLLVPGLRMGGGTAAQVLTPFRVMSLPARDDSTLTLLARSDSTPNLLARDDSTPSLPVEGTGP
jgi:hypothetical protein